MERLMRFFGTPPYPFRFLFTANFFLSLHLFLQIYICAPYLSTFFPEPAVGALYSIGAGISVIALYLAPQILRKLGNYRALIIFAVLSFFATLSLALAYDPLLVAVSFVLIFTLSIMMGYSLDIFLEAFSTQEDSTGGIRGMFLTVTNTALIISPLLTGFILGDGSAYRSVFLYAAAAIVPFAAIMALRFQQFTDPVYHRFLIRPTFASMFANVNLRSIVAAQFLLRFFYAWMVVYMPIYLYKYIGLAWSEIGVIFTVMLLPFVILQLPAGKIADISLGEKEILIFGFALLVISSVSISFITTTSVFVWAIVLFFTRVGAALVEIMTESYFFKHVKGDDTNVIAGFRMTNPLAFLLAPLVASVALFFIDISLIFILLGAILIAGLFVSMKLADTR